MKIILDPDTMDQIFGSTLPPVTEILKNKLIKQMTKNCEVVGVSVDNYNANDLGNMVIEVVPSLSKGNKNGK